MNKKQKKEFQKLFPGARAFEKDGIVVSTTCIRDAIGVSQPNAHIRCTDWEKSKTLDLDWLFRPPRQSKTEIKKLQEEKKKLDMIPSGTIYERQLWGY